MPFSFIRDDRSRLGMETKNIIDGGTYTDAQ